MDNGVIKLKINNEIKSTPRWKTAMPNCSCNGKLNKCLHCKYTQAEESIPRDDFIVKDKSGNDITVSEITLVIGKHDDVIGWVF